MTNRIVGRVMEYGYFIGRQYFYQRKDICGLNEIFRCDKDIVGTGLENNDNVWDLCAIAFCTWYAVVEDGTVRRLSDGHKFRVKADATGGYTTLPMSVGEFKWCLENEHWEVL